MQLRWNIIFVVLFFPLVLPAQTDRFQELFIWKMSEALKLTPEKEEAFTNAVKSLNESKMQAMQKVDAALLQLKDIKTESTAKVQVNRYREALAAYHKISQDELTEMAKIFNYSELAQYLSIKTEIMKRLQEKILDSQKESKKEVSPRKPKIILDE